MSRRSRLIVRSAASRDLEAVRELTDKAYPVQGGYSRDELRGHINNFPDGQLVAEYEGQVVGYCATICLPEAQVLVPHTWAEITANGYGSTHDTDGDYLYGYEVCVDPDFRGIRIAQRLYKERFALCTKLGLKGIVFGGRLPGLRRRLKSAGGAAAYVEKVVSRQWRDSVLTFQLNNGFEVIGVLAEYMPEDRSSMGYAAHLLWRNPDHRHKQPVAEESHVHLRLPSTVRVGVVQQQLRAVASVDEFRHIVTYFVRELSDNRCDFVVFPELFTLSLLAIENHGLAPHEAIGHLADYESMFRELMSDLAVRFNINIIAGSHPTRVGDDLQNMGYVYLRDGSAYRQPKIHPTPGERYWWNIRGGNSLNAIETDCGPIGVLVCYDSEFPELGRHLANQGIHLLFVPFDTEDRNGYMRVHYSSHARAIENQIYVATAGNVGNLPHVQATDLHYARSEIMSPCDFTFARDGIAADTTPNVEMIAIADLRLDVLREARTAGTVQNLLDRRHDLYGVQWKARRWSTQSDRS